MRIGTRASALALAQAKLVGGALRERGAIDSYELVPLVTSGDRGVARADKSRWVAELEQALLAGEVDLAVHSAKDVPAHLREGLELLGAPTRAPAEDVLCGARGLEELPPGARVGTSSLRRGAQLRAARADLEVLSLRGNVDTRLRRLAEPDGTPLDAIVLARAALQRLGREGEQGAVLDPERFVPAPGQGTPRCRGARATRTRPRRSPRSVTRPRCAACWPSARSRASCRRAATRRWVRTHCPWGSTGCACAPGWDCPTARPG